MIVGLGEDLVAIDRIGNLINDKGDAFLSKCFTTTEIEASKTRPSQQQRDAYFAKRFAGKEACLKALGTGMREGLSWHDMEIGNDTLGRPVLEVSGGVRKALDELAKNAVIHITLSDEAGLAHATVILER
jgi:holo-[acyl-carrier protein] synthase